ncbi:MAG: glycoside hydrolase family 28 protein, partial [Planctomycetota bacterium]
ARLAALLLAWTGVAASAREAAGRVEPYPAPPGAHRSEVYSVSVGGRDVFVVKYKDVSYAHFGLDGSADVTVAAAEEIESHSISPKSYRIAAKSAGRRLSFRLTRPRKLIVTVNDLGRLFVFADPLERNPPKPGRPGARSILEFGVDPAGRDVQTEKLQRAIDEISAQRGGRGGVLCFPAGRYLTGTINLRSNVTVYLAPGALLQGSSKAKHYPRDELGGRIERSRLIFFDNVRNANLVGRGTVDGDGKRVRRKRMANLIRGKQSSDCRIEGVVLRDSAAWNTHLFHSDRVTVRNIKMINDLTNPNSDGVDPDSARHVTIEDCFMYCSDDCVAVKSTGREGLLRDTEDILVRGNVFWTRKSAQKIGTETGARFMRRIVFENNDVVHADRTLYLVVKDGATVEDCHFRNIRTEQIGGDKHRKMFLMEISKRGGVGLIRNITISDWTAEDYGPRTSSIWGYDKRHEISGVTFHNLVIKGRTCMNLKEAGIGDVRFARDIRFTADENRR